MKMLKKLYLVLTVVFLICMALSSCGLFGKKECEHSYTEKVVAPTCTAEGYTEHTCSECGDTYKDVPTQKVAHPYKQVTVSPTCTAEGYTEHTCTVCGDSYKDTTVAKISHTYEAEVIAPTCIAEGYTKHTCSVCGDSYKDTTVANISHTYEAEIVDPTCTAEGYTKHTCTSCGDSYNDTATTKTAHRFNGAACKYCAMEEITENITPDTEWYSSDKTSFLISTPAQLAGFASLVNSGTTFSGKSVYLDADIDLGYYEWIPIGNSANAFKGTFSGEGYSVYGLKINASAAYVGLFGNSTGKITKLNVINATVYSGNNYNYVSIACGYSGGEISDVSVSGYIDAKISSYVAGVVGSTSAIIKNCTNNAEIVADGYVGGIAGLSSNNISNCTNNGNISGKASYVGGIAGNVESSAERIFKGRTNNGSVSGRSYVGGVMGRIYQFAETLGDNNYTNSEKGSNPSYTWYNHYYCYTSVLNTLQNFGDVTATESYAGGIIGYLYVSDSYYKTVKHENHGGNYSSNACSVYGDYNVEISGCENRGTVESYSIAGEIFGYFYSDAPSAGTTYTVIGSVTVNDEVKEGNCDVGSNNNLTLSGREVYVPETEMPEEGENAENSAE